MLALAAPEILIVILVYDVAIHISSLLTGGAWGVDPNQWLQPGMYNLIRYAHTGYVCVCLDHSTKPCRVCRTCMCKYFYTDKIYGYSCKEIKPGQLG